MKHIAQILSFSLALILAITFTTPFLLIPIRQKIQLTHITLEQRRNTMRHDMYLIAIQMELLFREQKFRCGKQLAISVKSGM